MEAAIGAAHVPVGKSRVAIIDAECLEMVSGHRWFFNGRYAYAKIGGGRVLLMHRVILGVTGKAIVDHSDGDGLNNRRSNLRACSHAQNMRNRSKISGRSRFKGVHLDKQAWRAQINFDGRRIRIGRFPTETAAARAYDEAALFYHGEFAKTNEQLRRY